MNNLTLPALKPIYSQVQLPSDEVLRRFDYYLKYGKKTPETRRMYRSVLGRWSAFAVLLSPSNESLYRWIRARKSQVKLSTYNLDLTVLRTFYKWAYESGYTSEDFSCLVPKSQRSAQRLPRLLTEKQIGRLLAEPDISTFVGFRDHVIMRLLYETGITASELVRLTISSITDDHRLAILSPDGRKVRRIPFAHHTGALLRDWINLRRSVRPGKSNTLFVTSKGKGFTQARSVWEIMNRYARSAIGIGSAYDRILATGNGKPWDGFYPHLLRASFATHLVERGCDFRAVQEFLGHADIHTAIRYLAVDVETLRRETVKHPRSKIQAG